MSVKRFSVMRKTGNYFWTDSGALWIFSMLLLWPIAPTPYRYPYRYRIRSSMSQQRALESLSRRSTLGVRLSFSIWDRTGIDTPHTLASFANVSFLYSRHILRRFSSDDRRLTTS